MKNILDRWLTLAILIPLLLLGNYYIQKIAILAAKILELFNIKKTNSFLDLTVFILLLLSLILYYFAIKYLENYNSKKFYSKDISLFITLNTVILYFSICLFFIFIIIKYLF